MLRSQIFHGSGPLLDLDATIGNVAQAEIQVGGGHGDLLTASVDGIACLDANVDVDSHLGGNSGIDLDASVGLDGALINAAANLGGLLDLGGCGCGDTHASAGADIDVNVDASLPDIGLCNPLSLSSLDLSGIDLFCGDNT